MANVKVEQELIEILNRKRSSYAAFGKIITEQEQRFYSAKQMERWCRFMGYENTDAYLKICQIVDRGF